MPISTLSGSTSGWFGESDAADDALKRIGYILQCKKCQYRVEQQGMFPEIACCPHCKEKLHPIGPLWLGSIQHEETLVHMQEMLKTMQLGTKKSLPDSSISAGMNYRQPDFMIITGSQKLWGAHHRISIW